MAYSKKTWKARQGLGLNKFSIDGATPVPVVNQPDSVTQQGDALSAGNLNDLETRIANAFDDVEEGKADKATTDDLQSQIVNLNTDVATLDAIVGCEAEIENTDPSEGQSILSSSRLIHHVNLLPSGEFGLVGARDIVHEGSIVNLNPTGFRIRGVNLWDEDWEAGRLNTTGQNSAGNGIRSRNYISISPNATYYELLGSYTGGSSMFICFYDANKEFISYFEKFGSTNFSTPANACYMRFAIFTSSAVTAYNHDIQICDNSLPSSVKTVYHPFSGQTVPVSIGGHYVNENCFDYVTNKTVDGVLRGELHTKVGSVDLGSLTWSIVTGIQVWQADLDAKPVSVSSVDAPMLCDTYTPSHEEYLSQRTGEIAITTTGKVRVNNGSSSISPTGNLLYELATEVVTYTEPLRSFSVSDYCTIEPITPQNLPNRVDVPFSVLSKSNNGIIEQIAQNTADIADNKAILSQHEARIANLEQEHGKYVTSDLQDYSTVPSGKASFALVETMHGVSRVENQLVQNGDFASTDGWQAGIFAGSTITASNNVLTIESTGVCANAYHGMSYVTGHKYLLSYDIRTDATLANGAGFYTAEAVISSTSVPTANWHTETVLITATSSDVRIGFYASGASASIQIRNVNITDLTIYFNGGTIPTLAEIQQYYPELLEPRAYNAGEIVDSTYTSVTSRARNLFDGTYEEGTITNTGTNQTNSDNWRSDYIPILPNVNYYITQVVYKYFYDADKNFISMDNSGDKPFTSPSGAYYMRWRQQKADVNVAQLCINVSDSQNGTYTPYWSPVTIAIPSVTLKGAGSVSETLDVETGEVTHPLKTRAITDLTYSKVGGIFYALLSDAMPVADSNVVANILCEKFVRTSRNAMTAKGQFSISSSGSTIYINFYWDDISIADFLTAMSGIDFTYELKEADPSTSVTPVIDNTLKTEGGGTVFSDADVDGQFTMGFLNL